MWEHGGLAADSGLEGLIEPGWLATGLAEQEEVTTWGLVCQEFDKKFVKKVECFL